MAILIAIGVSTLVSDAILHLIPHVSYNMMYLLLSKIAKIIALEM